ncbi:MAG: ARMT1-like domain-containing protein [Oscillospiraceae bacterium]
MSIAFDTQCLLCHLQRSLEVVKPLGTEQQAMEFVRDLMQMYLDAPKDVGSPWFNPQTADLMLKHYGLPLDRMKEEKELSNAFVMERLDLIRQKIQTSADPVFTGLQFAVLGNYLDFSALRGQVSFEKLDSMLDKAFDLDLDKAVYDNFCRELQEGKKLLYLTDNAGEIGFDRLFAEELSRKYPHLEIIFCVRGDVTLNDATRTDAAAVGIPFPVIDNGNRVPGTQIDLLSREAKEAMDTADVILAKGMANCETLHGCGYNVYYAFLVKCPRFVERFKKPMLTPMLVKERA